MHFFVTGWKWCTRWTRCTWSSRISWSKRWARSCWLRRCQGTQRFACFPAITCTIHVNFFYIIFLIISCYSLGSSWTPWCCWRHRAAWLTRNARRKRSSWKSWTKRGQGNTLTSSQFYANLALASHKALGLFMSLLFSLISEVLTV